MKTKPKYQISTVAMQSSIRKLRLERGDALLVSNYETLRYLAEMPLHLDFVIPLVFAPNGVEKLTRQDLLNLLEQLDSAVAPGSGAMADGSTRAPL